MPPLTRLAFEVLQSDSTPSGLKAVACATLLAAISRSVDVPGDSYMTVWRYLLQSDASAELLHRHELINPEVARDAVRVLCNGDAGDIAHDLALAVLHGQNATEVGERDLMSLADRIVTETRVRRVTWLVEQVHEHRGLDPTFIVELRDRLSKSDDPAVRVCGVSVGALLPRLDETFAAHLMRDESAPVRTAVVETLEGVGKADREKALVLIRDHLAVESHRSVIAALHFALSGLIRAGGIREATDNTH